MHMQSCNCIAKTELCIQRKKWIKPSSTWKIITKCGFIQAYRPNKSAFNDLLRHVSRKASSMRYWQGDTRSKPYKRRFKRTPQKTGPKRKLTLKEELLLTLMKLRLGIILEVLGGLIWGFSNICIRDFQHMD